MVQDHGGGKYFVKPLSLGKCKLSYYEFEGEDKEPEVSMPIVGRPSWE